MSVPGLLLVLAAAICHATWNFQVKRIGGGPELVWLFSVISTVVYLPIAVIVVIVDEPAFTGWQLAFIAGSACLHMAYFLLLQQGYRRGDLSLVYPTARATGPLLSTAFAVVVLSETLTVQAAIGATVVVVGVVCLSGGLRRGARKLAISLGFGVAIGCLIATYTVWDAYAVTALMVPPLLMDYGSGALRAAALAPWGIRRWEQVRRHWRDHPVAVLAIALFNPLAYILVLYALTFTPVVYVAPTRELSVVIAVIMGSVLLGEGDLRRRLLWATVILAGVSLLATG